MYALTGIFECFENSAEGLGSVLQEFYLIVGGKGKTSIAFDEPGDLALSVTQGF
jgi:hypothetical protein